jgi:hypothetical protein
MDTRAGKYPEGLICAWARYGNHSYGDWLGRKNRSQPTKDVGIKAMTAALFMLSSTILMIVAFLLVIGYLGGDE